MLNKVLARFCLLQWQAQIKRKSPSPSLNPHVKRPIVKPSILGFCMVLFRHNSKANPTSLFGSFCYYLPSPKMECLDKEKAQFDVNCHLEYDQSPWTTPMIIIEELTGQLMAWWGIDNQVLKKQVHVHFTLPALVSHATHSLVLVVVFFSSPPWTQVFCKCVWDG